MKVIFTLLFAIFFYCTASAQLVINEVCYDPSNTALQGDANGDSLYDQTQDEFIELVNAGSTPLDISGYQISDSVISSHICTTRHTIAANTILPPGGAIVIFGGGVPRGNFGGAIVRADLGTAGLSFGNTGEWIRVADSSGRVILRFNTDALSDNPNESYTRSPDITGDFVQHSTLPGGLKFSPGRRVDGTSFVTSIRSKFVANVLKIYPNPNKGVFTFTTPVAETDKVTIANAIGKTVFEGYATNNSLDVNYLPNGVYFVTVAGKQKSYSVRLSVSH